MSAIPTCVENRSLPAACLHHAINEWAVRNNSAVAILAPGRRPLTYGELHRQVEQVVASLNTLGVSRNDRVAMVLPAGPEAAVALIAIPAGATGAPLNPAYSATEFDHYLANLNPSVLLVYEGSESPAVDVAHCRGIPVLELVPHTSGQAGLFALVGETGCEPVPSCFAEANDTALLLHTSGTSGKPKLVPLRHRNVCASLRNIVSVLELGETDRLLNVMPLFHIHGLSTLYAALAAGGSAVCAPGFSVEHFFDWLRMFAPTWYSAAPPIHRYVLDSAHRHSEIVAGSSLRFIRSASAPMPGQVMADLEREFGAPFIEAYGMTEAGPQIASNRLPPHPYKTGSVGQAAGPEVAIMDEHGNLLAAGEPGEVVIRGDNVMQGYENDSRVNKNTVVRDWLRTGDKGYLDADGYLFISGRREDIFNRGGEKISAVQIDEALMEHPAVAQAVTFALPHPVLGEDIAAAVVLETNLAQSEHTNAGASGGDHLLQEIRDFAAARLAHFQVPRQITIVKEILKGRSGKLCRDEVAAELRSLSSAPHRARAASETNPARTPVERKLADIWAGVLNIDRPGIHHNFFQLGGDSLAAGQVVARVEQTFRLELPVESLFEKPTIAGLALLIGQRIADLIAQGRVRLAPESLQLEQASGAAVISRLDAAGPLPLSFGQQRLWFLDQIGAGAAYNMSASLLIGGVLDQSVLARSLDEITRRHHTLRTSIYLVNGQVVQAVAPPEPTQLPLIDLTTLPAPQRKAEALRLAAGEVMRPFDLSRGPLFSATLVRLSAREHVLLLIKHHIISDGWSTVVLHRELGSLYESLQAGRPSTLPDLKIQYTDFACWQRARLQSNLLRDQPAYWKKQLAGLPRLSGFPADRPRPAIQTYRGSTRRVLINESLIEKLKALSLRADVTLFMTLLAVFKTLIFRYSNQPDCLVGTPIANRTALETEALIGFFANTLVLRTDLSGDPTFLELLGRVRTTARDAYAHAEVPFEKLVEELQPDRELSRTPLFQVMFVLQEFPHVDKGLRSASGCWKYPIMQDLSEVETGPGFQFGADLFARPFTVDSGTTKFDLTLYLCESQAGFVATWQYNGDLFEADTIERIARHFQILLQGVAADHQRRLSEYELLSESERCRIELGWSGKKTAPVPDCCFPGLFERQVERSPATVAVEFGARHLTYRELNERSNQLARHLLQFGVGPEVLVAIYLTRSIEMIVAILAIWKAGGAYIACDPQYPMERIAFMLDDTGARVVITDNTLLPPLDRAHRTSQRERSSIQETFTYKPVILCVDADRDIILREDKHNLAGNATQDQLAYVMYTSGSMGCPKGVMITQENVCHYTGAMHATLGVTAGDRYLHTASFAFSSSVRQFALALSCGATVVVAETDRIRDPLSLFDFIAHGRVSIIDLVPSYWSGCMPALKSLQPAVRAENLDSVRLILSASEQLTSEVAREWASYFEPGVRAINMYGQTETTGIVALYPVSHGETTGTVPIGQPIPNTRIYLLDSARRPVPIGASGEICVGGAGVGRGYLNHEGLTAERFVTDPFSGDPGDRLYRTGDIARYRADGNIEFLGRADQQIKVRGFRIEPGEVEVILRQHPQVREAVVVLQGDTTGTQNSNPLARSTQGKGGSRKHIAFVTLTQNRPVTAQDDAQEIHRPDEAFVGALRQFLKAKLPEYMLPSMILTLDVLPQLPSGKIDRVSLASYPDVGGGDMDPKQASNDRESLTPLTQVEEKLATIWRRVLGVESIAAQDNFFDLGGDSILSIQVVTFAREAGLDISLRQLFLHQTLAELALANFAPGRAGSAQQSANETGHEHSGTNQLQDSPVEEQISRHSIAGEGGTPGLITHEARDSVVVAVDRLRAYGVEALQRAGLDALGAEIVTEVQLEASLRSQPTHNMISIPRYARRIASAKINPQPRIRIEQETANSARMDGHNGPGQWVSVVAMTTAIQKARQSGIGLVSVRRSNHFGAAGHYAWLAAREGLIGLCTTNGPVILAPTGSLTPTLGNNPLAVGIPAANYLPILLDVTMSVAPRGKIGLKLAEGKPLPEGWILDRFGQPSTNLSDLAAGLGVPIGGHKGYGLALIMEVLAGALSGAGFCRDHRREQIRQNSEPPDIGHFFLVIDPGILMPPAEFTSRVDRMIEQVKAGERAKDVDEILIPGEAELRARERNIQLGVPLKSATYESLKKYGAEAGLQTEL